MKNILKVFLTDAGRISTNVVAIVVVMGLTVLPSLYAWFNIFSNWDPYGSSATSNMKIAVVSKDTGTEIEGETLNIGDSVISGLKANSAIGWVFADSSDQAVNGVYSGEYYAALIIPANFTDSMISFLSGKVQHPTITYYENEKKNAIAPKITSKAKTSVQEQVNASFVSTLAEVLVGSGKLATWTDDNGDTILGSTVKNLEDLEADLDAYLAILNSFIQVTDAAQGLLETGSNMLPEIQGIYQNSADMTTSMQNMLDFGQKTGDSADDMLTYGFQMLQSSLDTLKNGISADQATAQGYGAAVKTDLESAQAMMPYVKELFEGAVAPIEGLDPNADADIAQIRTQINDLQTTLQSWSESTTVADTKQLIQNVTAEISMIQTEMTSLQKLYQEKVRPDFDTSMNLAKAAIGRSAGAMNQMNSDFQLISPLLGQYRSAMSEGKSSLKESRELAQKLSDTVTKLTDDLKQLENDQQYQELMSILKDNPEALGNFISSPVNLETKEVYSIATYGSAMTPFYTVLALWVGALILVAIVHVKVEPIPGVDHLSSYQTYFGRYLLFYLIGQAQALLTVLGNLFYIRIQCHNPFLFWLAASMTSFTFTIFIYSLTVAFQNVGEALAVIIMVIQVAGAGGTFPIEVLPHVYQVVYRFLPFPYAMNSMRETIGGMYEQDYWIYLAKLAAYVLVSLVIGLVLGKPFRSLNHKIEKSKEKSGLMI